MAKRSCLVVLAAFLAGLASADALGSTTLATNPADSQVLLYQPLVQGSRPLFAATREPGGGFGPLKAIAPPPGVFDARAAIDDAGGAVAAWVSHDPHGQNPDRGFASIRAPGAEFGQPAQLFEAQPDSRITMASNAAGDTIVGAGLSATTARYAFRRAGGAFGDSRNLSTEPGFFRGFSIDSDGTAHAFSELQNIDASSDLYESVRPRDGEFGAFVPVLHLAFSDGLSFAASRTGRVLLLWDEHGTIRGIERAPGGSFSAPFDVAAGLNSTDIEQTPSVMGAAVTPSGAVAVAIRAADGSYLVAARKPGSKFVLSSRFNGAARVAVDDAGDAAAVWSTYRHAVRAIYRPSDKPRFDRSVTLDGPRPFAPGFESPSVVIDNSGRATAAWERDDGATIKLLAKDFRGARAGRGEVVGALPSFVREGPAEACRPAGARVVRSSPQSTVFVSNTYYGCLLARGVPARLDNFSLEPGPPSTISLAGPFVAYAGQAEFRIVDLRDPESGVNRLGELDGVGHGPAFLAASRMKPDGAAAWITCARSGKPGESRSRCLHAGGMTKRVFVWNRSALVPRLVDSGRTIRPATLKLRGSALSWRHGGKLHHARLR